jgi:predicted permease
MSRLTQDVRYALRAYLKAPGFTAIAVLVLAIGIGANSAMFTIVNALLFKPLSGQAGELFGVFSRDRTRPDSYRAFSYPNYADIRENTHDVFDGVTAHTFAMVGVSSGDTMRRSFVSVVSSNYFDTLDVRLAAGRTFSPDEERPGAAIPVAIAHYDIWRASGFDPGFVGRRVRINAIDFTIVGVTPRGFTGTMAVVAPEMWLPLGMFDVAVNDIFKNRGTGLGDRGNHGLNVAARLKPGVSDSSATARLEVVASQLERAYPGDNKDQALSISPLPRLSTSTEPQSNAGPAVLAAVLMAISGVVLVIACLNIANMLLARGTSRQKEIAIRLAIGGGRARVVRQLLTESFLLAAAGATGGLAVAFAGTAYLVRSLTPILPLTLTFDASPDLNIILATTALTATATMIFGIGPALRISRSDLVADLKDGMNVRLSAGRPSAFSAGNLLVVGQIALSLALLCTGGLFARGAMNAAATNPGFPYDKHLIVSLDAGMAAYAETQARQTYRDVLAHLRSIPGVDAAGFASTVPFGEFHEGMPVEALGQSRDQQAGRSPTFRSVGSDYFRALGLQMVRGREFTLGEEESPSGPRVAIVDEILARRLFPDRDAVGQMIRIPRQALADRGTGSANDGEPMQIVGIAPPIRDALSDREPVAHLYVPWGRHYRAGMTVHVRVAAQNSDDDVLASLRGEIAGVDPRLPILEVMRMQQFHDRSFELWAMRAGGTLVIVLGALALVLAVVGVYGVKSYVVSQRTREIGIRMALGARSTDVLWMLVADGARLTAAGLAAGLPLAALAGLAASRLLYDVSPIDPVVFLVAPLTLATAALVAAWVPARRATRVTPMIALRID